MTDVEINDVDFNEDVRKSLKYNCLNEKNDFLKLPDDNNRH